MEKLIPMPPEHITDMELYCSNRMTREEIRHQNKMIRIRNKEKQKK